MSKVSKITLVKSNSSKGRQNVEKKLIESAAELVGSIGPNQLTIRDIANHGSRLFSATASARQLVATSWGAK